MHRRLFPLCYRILFKAVPLLTGIELPCETKIGCKFVIDRFRDFVISGYASFGDN